MVKSLNYILIFNLHSLNFGCKFLLLYDIGFVFYRNKSVYQFIYARNLINININFYNKD